MCATLFNKAKGFNQCISMQPNTTLIGILYLTLTQYPYDPGPLPSSANQCMLGALRGVDFLSP